MTTLHGALAVGEENRGRENLATARHKEMIGVMKQFGANVKGLGSEDGQTEVKIYFVSIEISGSNEHTSRIPVH